MPDNRMLVVDDDATTRFALHTLFSRQGWDVSVAATVSEALDELGRTPTPRCVILDLNLPDGRGEAILARRPRGPVQDQCGRLLGGGRRPSDLCGHGDGA